MENEIHLRYAHVGVHVHLYLCSCICMCMSAFMWALVSVLVFVYWCALSSACVRVVIIVMRLIIHAYQSWRDQTQA